MVQRISALVVTSSRPLRDSLTTLLSSISSISHVYQASDGVSGLYSVEVQRPALVVLDASLPGGDAWRLLRQIRTRWPMTSCVVLADTVPTRRRAEAAGASCALLKGYPAAKLAVMLEQMVQ
ncbi:MAG: response regulator [Anaerolineae bacterium]